MINVSTQTKKRRKIILEPFTLLKKNSKPENPYFKQPVSYSVVSASSIILTKIISDIVLYKEIMLPIGNLRASATFPHQMTQL